MPITYHVAEHDEGYAYRVGDVWSESFPNHDAALAAARSAAERQQVGGDPAEITSSSPMGLGKHRWLTVVTDQKLTWSTTLDNAVLTPNHLSEKS